MRQKYTRTIIISVLMSRVIPWVISFHIGTLKRLTNQTLTGIHLKGKAGECIVEKCAVQYTFPRRSLIKISRIFTLFRWTTKIVLPLKEDMQSSTHASSLAARFQDVHPSLLLFLHRLKAITVVNKVSTFAIKIRCKEL